ncbi:MAG: hypothetical protein FJY76_00110, partial [Candidatus Aenigmarchaeota archaeon]|nr:hypothetical protein [Candidatus Aenigmarchaeota archaeon]
MHYKLCTAHSSLQTIPWPACLASVGSGGNLAYKTYKKVKGRKHGPYFYKNIRTKEGVKTIYLGKDRESALRKEAELAGEREKGEDRPFRRVRAVSRGRSLPYWVYVPVLVIIVGAFFALQPPAISVAVSTQSGMQGSAQAYRALDGSINVNMMSAAVEPGKPAPQVSITGITSPPASIESKIDLYSGGQPEKGRIATPVVAVNEELSFREATVTLPKSGDVNAIMRCKGFDFESFTCPAWERTGIPFTDNGDTITFRVSSFSAYAGALIEISKAELLDPGRNFIADIYQQVRSRDGNFSAVGDSQYVRVTFERALDNSKDITVYAKSASTSEIEVYREDGNEIVAKFEDISEDRMYKVYLANLEEGESRETFDLKINSESGIEIDYIVDPSGEECWGTITASCGDILSGSACTNVSSCSWDLCANDYDCSIWDGNSEECDTHPYCSWDDPYCGGDGSCNGFNNYEECQAYEAAGCSWNVGCSGDVTDTGCSQLSNSDDCGAVSGCTWSFPPANLSDTIYRCGSLSAGTYALNHSISDSGDCLTISASDVAIDCAGFSITGDGTGTGINADATGNGENGHGVMINDCNIGSFETSVSSSGAANSEGGNGGSGGNITINNSITGNIASNGGYSDTITSGNGGNGGTITITNSTAGNLSSVGGSPYGYSVAGGSGGDIYVVDSVAGNINGYGGDASGGSYGESGGSGGNAIINNSVTGDIDVSGSSVGSESQGNGGSAGTITTTNSTAGNLNANGGSGRSGGNGANGGEITISKSSINLNNKAISLNYGTGGYGDGAAGILTLNYSSSFSDEGATYGNDIKLKIINNYGSIHWYDNVVSSGLSGLSSVAIANNSAYVNSSALPSLSIPANATLYGIGNRGFSNPRVLKDGFTCTGCTNYTALNANTVLFSVLGWSNYSVGEDNPSSINVYPEPYKMNNYTNNDTPLFYFNYTGTDITASCELFINSTGYGTNTSAANSTSTFILANHSLASQDYYSWHVNCTGAAGNTGKSASNWLIYDATKASLALQTTTPNGSFTRNTSVYMNLTFNDNLAAPAYSFINFNNSLAGWWRFDDADPLMDMTGSGNNGAAEGNASQAAAGKFGESFAFDGDGDYVETPEDERFGNYDQISISFWMYPLAVGGNNPPETGSSTLVVTNSINQPSLDWGFEYRNNGSFSFMLWQGCDENCGVATPLTETNAWYHVVGTSDGSTMKLYINGNLTATGNSRTGSFGPRSIGIGTGLCLGSPYACWGGFFNGSIDEVMVFNRSLNSTEIGALYNSSQYALNASFSGLADANYTYRAYTIDAAGNMNSTGLFHMQVDTTPPAVTLDNGTAASLKHGTTAMLQGTCSDSGSGPNQAWTNSSYFTGVDSNAAIINLTNTSRLPSSPITIYVFCNDTIGSNASAGPITLSFTPPTGTAHYNDASSTINVTGPANCTSLVQDMNNLSIASPCTSPFAGTCISVAANINVTDKKVGGNLTLNGCELRMNMTADGSRIITSWGNLTVISSNITTNNSNFETSITAKAGSNFTMRDSAVSELGWGDSTNQEGLALNTTSTIINTSFLNGFMCIKPYSGGGGSVIENSTFNACFRGVYLYLSDGNVINGSTFTSCTTGVMTAGGNNMIENNIFRSNTYAISFASGNNNTLRNNSIWNCQISCLYFGISNNNTIIGGMVNLTKVMLIDMRWSNNTLFQDVRFINGTNIPGGINLTGEANSRSQATFLNCSFTGVTEATGANSQIVRSWYLDTYVNYTNATAAAAANISVRNATSILLNYTAANSTGWGYRLNITQYINNSGTVTYANNHTIYANLSGFLNASMSWDIGGGASTYGTGGAWGDWGGNNTRLTLTLDAITPPLVNAVNATPASQGFGQNATIWANVTDANGQADISAVWTQVTSPLGETSNLTLSSAGTYLWKGNYTLGFTN